MPEFCIIAKTVIEMKDEDAKLWSRIVADLEVANLQVKGLMGFCIHLRRLSQLCGA